MKKLKMEDNGIHTSVVIELANQEDSEDLKTYKTDFDEMEIPKDYVIDQIFCGENITVYALFELPDSKSKKSQTEFTEIQNSTLSDDSRYIPRTPFKRTLRQKSKTYGRKSSMMDSEEEIRFVANECNRSRSIYCLKHSAQNYDIPHREEENSDLKVLFSKDFISKGSKQIKYKGVSKGVNTDIAQSPKIIDEIQRAINMGFSYERGCEKEVEITKIPFAKSSCQINEADVKQSISSFSSDAESMKHSKKSSPNYLFVPLLMIEERFMSHFQKDIKIQALPEEKKTRIIPKKVSLGTNTETFDSSPLTSDSDEIKERKSHYPSQFGNSKIVKSEVDERNEEKENKTAKSHLKKKDKDTILSEIRKLQGKLSSLIKSIEYNGLSLSTDDDDRFSELEKRTSEMVMRSLEKTSEAQITDSEPFQKYQNRYDDIPIFSPLILTPQEKNKKVSCKKKAESSDREAKKKASEELVKSASSGSLPQQEKISTDVSTSKAEKVAVKPKNVFSGLNVNWELKMGRSVGPSKSDTSNRCSLPVPKYNCVKKSVSFDQRDDKVEMCGLKKIKNSSFKVEGSLKTNLRSMQTGEVRLGENLTSLRREMGDEAKKEIEVSKTESPDFNDGSGKEEVIFLKNGTVDIKKSLNEEEGDAKLIYPNQNLVTQKFVQDSDVHFCRPNAIASDAVLKGVKVTNPPRVKSKTAKKTEESGAKACSDTEKPTTPSRTYRKNIPESNLKKEVNPMKKPTAKSKILERKIEKKDITGHEVTKPKSVSGSRKLPVKDTAESKLHVDKLIKFDSESKHDSINNQKAMKVSTDEKSGGKTEKLSRPHSQKREHRDNSIETNDRKETEKKINKKKSDTLIETEARLKKKSPDMEVREVKEVREAKEMKEVKEVKEMKEVKEVKEMKEVKEVKRVKENAEQSKTEESKAEVLQESEPSPPENSAWLSSNTSSVVVELFSEKPKLREDCYGEAREGYGNLENPVSGRSESECQRKINCGNQDKPIVKSIWALTKVLLYEDGTKKLEVLEASLTPPGYCLNSTDQK